ncbi:4Fe-4S binding protein [Geovibrio ferrireducens]|uniref:4Fe-4S binding protein n=1 Tax=Geovibrio ferrireducens TaxID=46201 RepID=UPI00224859F0|nr:4Fe-4S binding protein [Geovibrio ferrireducens]
MKQFLSGFALYLRSDKTSVRRLIQYIFLASTIYVGIRFYFYLSALGAGDMSAVKPGGVEAFLPISALMGLKRLVFSGNYDMIHPAGLTLLIVFLLISIIFKRGFCGYICPVGLISETVGAAGKNIKIHRFIAYPLFLLKYLLLGFFVYIILIQMSLPSIEGFLNAPYNKVSDAKMMDFFADPSRTTLIVLAVLMILGLLFRNFWCRFLCPYGALMGLVSLLSPFKIKRDKDACINCMKCTNICPMDIQVHKAVTVHSPECIGCHDCVRVRANDKCLKTYKTDYRYLTLAVFLLFWAAVAAAMLTGFWQSEVSNEEYRFWLERLGQLSH